LSLVKLGFGVTGNNASAGGYKIDQSWQLDLKLGITEGTMPSEFTRHELFPHKYLMEKDLLFSDTRVMIEHVPNKPILYYQVTSRCETHAGGQHYSNGA
jgi:hypothetical protein